MAQMTVSQLIKALQKIEGKYGDAGVTAYPDVEPERVTIVERVVIEDDEVVLREAR